MEKRPLAFLLLSLMALFASFAYSFMNPFPTFFTEMPLSLLVIGFFFFGAMAFGYLSFVPHVFMGLAMGAERNAAIFLYLLPVMLATYSGALLGSALEKDFRMRKYFLEDGKKVLALLAIAIALAVAIDLALPYIIQYWPQDWMGMNMKQGGDIWSLISGLPGAARQ
jgi:hypothetical protein